MERYRFQFGDNDGLAAEAIESDHGSDDDAMCEAAHTAAEMLKEQAHAAKGLRTFSLAVHRLGGAPVGAIKIDISQAEDRL
ncbi:DUF6894 family protein [Sphingomonas floccifaciens]|uniref:DUF6894 family protein n=1 Tax=Sphingomonas floccifaciens TaxID=1844115 RepID=A0ABW4NI16_9SPHN